MATDNSTLEKKFKEYFELEAKIKELTEKKDAMKSDFKAEIKEGDSEFVFGTYKVQIRCSVTKTLKADLIKKELGVDVTDKCYKVTTSNKCYILDTSNS